MTSSLTLLTSETTKDPTINSLVNISEDEEEKEKTPQLKALLITVIEMQAKNNAL